MSGDLTDAAVHGTGGDEIPARVELGREDLPRMPRQFHHRRLEATRPWSLYAS